MNKIVGRTLTLLLLLLPPAGCFHYVPAELDVTPPGEGVRVQMTRAGASELASVTAVDEAVPSVEGTVVGTENGELLLRVPVGQRQTGFVPSGLSQTIRVPTGEILSFERRELDKAATGLFIGAGVGIAATALIFILDPSGRGEPENTDPPDDLMLRIGLISIPIGD